MSFLPLRLPPNACCLWPDSRTPGRGKICKPISAGTALLRRGVIGWGGGSGEAAVSPSPLRERLHGSSDCQSEHPGTLELGGKPRLREGNPRPRSQRLSVGSGPCTQVLCGSGEKQALSFSSLQIDENKWRNAQMGFQNWAVFNIFALNKLTLSQKVLSNTSHESTVRSRASEGSQSV